MAISTYTISPAHSTTSVCFKVTFHNFYDANERFSALNSKTVWLDDLTQCSVGRCQIPDWLALRPDWLALRPAWLGLRPAWLALGPSRGGRTNRRTNGRTNGWTDRWTNGQMDGQTDRQTISLFYRTLSTIGYAESNTVFLAFLLK